MEIGRPSGPRKSVNLLVQLAEEGGNDFVEEKYAIDLSSGGMFVCTRTPRPVGTSFQVRVEIAGGARLLQGHAIVRWTRKDGEPGGLAGMGLEFTNVDPASAALIDRMLKPSEGTDLAAELTNALANELSDELDAGADFTDDFAAAPPVRAGEESGDFTDDFEAAAPASAAGPEDFTEDFEELATAPSGVMVPEHLRNPETGELLTEPFGMKLPPPLPDIAQAVVPVPLDVGVPDTTEQPVPLDEDVPDTDPKGVAIPTLANDGFADTAEQPAFRPVAADDDGTADTGQRPAFVPGTPDTGKEQPAHVPDDLDSADTAQRPAFRPAGWNADDGTADTGERAAHVPPADGDTAKRAAMTPAQAAAVLAGLSAPAPAPAPEDVADTAKRAAMTPAQAAAVLAGLSAPAPADELSDTAKRAAMSPAQAAAVLSGLSGAPAPEPEDVADTAKRAAMSPAQAEAVLAGRRPAMTPLLARSVADGVADTGKHAALTPALERTAAEATAETGPRRPISDEALRERRALTPAIARGIDEGVADTGGHAKPVVSEGKRVTGELPIAGAGATPLAQPVPIDVKPAAPTPLEQRVPIDVKPAVPTPPEQPVPIDVKPAAPTPLEQPAPIDVKPAAPVLPDARPLDPARGTLPTPSSTSLPAPPPSAPLFGGGLAIPPTEPVRPSAPRSSGRWSGVPKTAELRTEAVGLPSLEAPSAPEKRSSAELHTDAVGPPALESGGRGVTIDLKAPVPPPEPPPADVERTIVGPMPVAPPSPSPPEVPTEAVRVPLAAPRPSSPVVSTAGLFIAPPAPSAPRAPAAPPAPDTRHVPEAAPSAVTETQRVPASAPRATTVVAAPVPAPMLDALHAQRTPAKPPEPEPEEAVFDLDEAIDPPADRTFRGPMPAAPPLASPAPLLFETSETPSEDRTGQFDMSAFAEATAPPAPAAPKQSDRVLASNPAFAPAAPKLPDRVLASNPSAFAAPAQPPKSEAPVLKPSDPSPLASPRTTRGKDTGLKPAVPPRAEAPRAKTEAVNISVKELVRTTPKPPEPEATSVVVEQSMFTQPNPALPKRSTTRELTAPVPRGVLQAQPVKRSKKVDDLQFLGPPPEFVKDSPLVGIDLGTTNSVCAVLAGGRPVVLKTSTGSNVVPSLVAINKSQRLAVGYAAHAEFLHNPAQCIYGSKRLVGRDFDSPAVDAVRERFAYEIVAGPDGKAAVMLGGKRVSLEEIQAIVLTECRLMAEKYLSKRVSRAVVTCPAYFTEPQRQSIRVAGALAGLRIERILIEPTAAALAYGLNQDLSRKVLVYDVGGGTFDATLLRIEKNVFEVLATGGDVFLGGLDFDHQLIDALVKRFEAEHNVLFNADPGALARIADQAEKAKIALSEKESVEVRLPMLQLGDRGRAMGLSCTLTRAELEEFSTPLVERTIEVVQGLLKDAKLQAADVDEVVLVGGMSRMPMVRGRLRQLFRKQPHASINAEEAIAVGAALFTGVVDQVSNVVLIDVAPMTIGFGMPGGAYKRVIHRNTPLPASASMGVATTEDMSEVIEVEVFQGEDPDVSVNDYVGTIRIDGLPRAPKGVVKVAINLKLDANCVLHVDARELHTRRRFESTLATRYTTAEVQQKLGIKPQAARAAVVKRTAELKQRSGGIFGFLRSAFSRKRD